MTRLGTFLEAIKFEHTIFALPFAYVGMLLAADGVPTVEKIVWITVAMAGARTLAMVLNRLIDREIDARNPRTANRALPRGLLAPREMAGYALVAAVVLGVAAWQLKPLCLALMPGAVVLLVGYSYTKRFTWLCHLALGAAIGLAPVGAWVGVTGRIDPQSLILWLAVGAWIAGFDVLYACQDVEVDRAQRLHSIPARFGIGAALGVSAGLHVITVAALVWVGMLAGLGAPYWLAVGAAAVLLVYEHALLRPHDLSRLNVAFFNVNGYIALVVLAGVVGTFVPRWWR